MADIAPFDLKDLLDTGDVVRAVQFAPAPVPNVAILHMPGRLSFGVEVMPGRFHRAMSSLLLGWRWEVL